MQTAHLQRHELARALASFLGGQLENFPAGLHHFLTPRGRRRRGRIAEYAEEFGCDYHEGKRPWGVPCDLAFPCATQNELDAEDAKALVDNGCLAVSEGANMPTTVEGIEVIQASGMMYGPGKAANAGGVAVSGLEMTQNSIRLAWTAEELESRLEQSLNPKPLPNVRHLVCHG